MRKFIAALIFSVVSIQLSMAQHTVGIINYDPATAFDGYNLIYPHNQPNAYLLNNCGQLVNVWEDEETSRPGNTAYITEEGNLIKTKRPADFSADPIWAGGGGETVEIRSWENDLLWTFSLKDSTRRLHHDIEPMPNGNILMIVWEYKSLDELLEAGMDTSLLDQEYLWPDYIIEVEPVGTDEFNIVWEWHAWDHLIQDHDADKENFGPVEMHPELIDLNIDIGDGTADWMHSNAIDYNPDYDQVMLCVPDFDEIWVIDHSTTSEQAAGHTGGLAGKGGDLVYRWGNPSAYRAGTAEDKKLFFQHDAHWINEFVDSSHPDYNKVLVFNNRAGEDFSAVNIFDPAFNSSDWEYPFSGGVFGPADHEYTYTKPVPSDMYSGGMSSAQMFPNSHILIINGRSGNAFEIDQDDQIIWEYEVPLVNGIPVSQGDEVPPNANLTFRIKRYPADFAGFTGKDLSPKGYIENNPDSTYCDMFVSIEQLSHYNSIKCFPNPATETLIVEGTLPGDLFQIYDSFGRLTDAIRSSGDFHALDVSNYIPGLYFIQSTGAETLRFTVVKQ